MSAPSSPEALDVEAGGARRYGETMRVVVTGANGFVGRALAERLQADGREVVRVSRRGGDGAVAVGDIGPQTDWRVALGGAKVVVHAAARVHVAPERAREQASLFERVNRAGTLALYEAAAVAGARLVVFVSSITVLGAATAPGRPFRDDDPTAPDTVYAESKAGAEHDLARRAGAGGPALTVLRPPLVVGPGAKGNLASLARLAALPLPLPLGGIGNRRTLLALRNLTAAIERVIDAPDPAGTFNLGDAAPVSTNAIVAALREGLGRRPGLLPCPSWLLGAGARLVGRPGFARRLLGNLEVDSSRFRARFAFRDEVDTTTALADTARAMRATSRP